MVSSHGYIHKCPDGEGVYEVNTVCYGVFQEFPGRCVLDFQRVT